MKIGVLTLFRALNAGSVLQALTTIRVLKVLLPDARVELLDMQFAEPGLTPWWRVVGRRNLWNGPLALRAWRKHRSYRLVVGALPKSSFHLAKNYDQAGDVINSLGYDALVIGSDEVLRLYPAWPIEGGYPPPSWVPPNVTAPRFMLASSSGTTNWSQLTEVQQRALTASVAGFRWMAVRDEMTFDLIEAASSDHPPLCLVPDPTFAFDLDSFVSSPRWLPRWLRAAKQPVVACRVPDTKWTRSLVEALRTEGYLVVSFGSELPNARNFGVALSIWDFPRVFRYCDVVLTGSFHDTIFSLRNSVCPIAVDVLPHRVDSDTCRSKTRLLLQSFGLERLNHVDAVRSPDARAVCRQIRDARAAFDAESATARCADFRREYEAGATRVASEIRASGYKPLGRDR